LITGLLLTRIDIFQFKKLGWRDPQMRSVAYWAHVITPVLALWLYILHRLAGPRINWRVGLRLGCGRGFIVLGMVFCIRNIRGKTRLAPLRKEIFRAVAGPDGFRELHPRAHADDGQLCLNCHEDAYQGWFHSAHRFSSFNNKPYLFSVRETRQVALKRDGNVKAARWCAGCHDVVPFFSGAF